MRTSVFAVSSTMGRRDTMRETSRRTARERLRLVGMLGIPAALAVVFLAAATGTGAAAVSQGAPPGSNITPKVIWATAHDVSPALRDLVQGRQAPSVGEPAEGRRDDDEGPTDAGYSG